MTSVKAPPQVKKVLVATDRSQSADRAARWAASLASGYGAELVVLQVLVPPSGNGAAPQPPVAQAKHDLDRFAYEIAGERARARVMVDADPSGAILRAVDEERVDTVVVGNVGMAGRKQFLLGNVPNRISHGARCNVIIVNTAGESGRASALASPADSAGAYVEGRLLGRAMRIGRVLVKAGAREMLGRQGGAGQATAQERARRFSSALEELGPTFGKLGQILSTRPDLLPPGFQEELARLQERVAPLTEAQVVAAMERELRVPWEDVFAGIDPTPLAAGTIAQVHRARLESGDRVVVKLQRPNAERDILLDLALLEMFAKKTAARPTFRRVVDIPAIVNHLSGSLRRELDFRREAGNMDRMARVLAPYPRLAVPAVYKEYSTARLLVMQEVQGVPVRQAPEGPARKEAARQLLESFYRQVLVEGFFHADPHPGNMKWWNDRIYLLDLGMVGEVEPRVREMLLLLLLAFSQKDAPFLTSVTLALAEGASPAPDGLDREAFERDMAGMIERYRGLSLKEIQLGPMLQEMTRISVRHNVRMPASLALIGKAFAQMQSAAAELDPTLDPFAVASSFVMRNTVQQLAGSLDPAKVFYEAQKLRVRLARLLEAAEGVVGARPGGRLQVEFKGTERLERAISQASRRLALALGATGGMLGAAVTAAAGLPLWAPLSLACAGGAFALALAADLLRGGR